MSLKLYLSNESDSKSLQYCTHEEGIAIFASVINQNPI